MNKTLFGSICATALVGVMASGCTTASNSSPTEVTKDTTAKAYCENNTCKGHSSCKGHGNNSCKGQNECKGHGFVDASDAKTCKTGGGKWVGG